MKKVLVGLWLAALASVVYAQNCTTQTIIRGDKLYTCKTCCNNFGHCTTTCF